MHLSTCVCKPVSMQAEALHDAALACDACSVPEQLVLPTRICQAKQNLFPLLMTAIRRRS